MKMKNLILAASVLFALSSSCKKEEEPIDNPNDTINNVDTTKYTKVVDVHDGLYSWKYFNFTTGAVVGVTNFQDTLSWDLGIHYESFRTNGGASGIGQGAVLDLGAVDFDGVTISSISGKTFEADSTINVLAGMNGYQPIWENTPGSALLEAMFQSPTGPGARTYTPNNHVYVLKTAKGKHVKIIGTSMFNDLAAEGYFNFEYKFLD